MSTDPEELREPAGNDAQYKAWVKEGKQIVAYDNKGQWRIGEIADSIETSWGGGQLAKYAKEIGLASYTVDRRRLTYRAWEPYISAPGAEKPLYSVARELADLPDRFEIIKNNPKLTKAEAVKIKRERNGKVPAQKPKADSLAESIQKMRRVMLEVVKTIERETKIAENGEIDPESELAAVLREELDEPWLQTMTNSFERGLDFVAVLQKVVVSEPEQPEEEQPKVVVEREPKPERKQPEEQPSVALH
jgi:hypothetical protein